MLLRFLIVYIVLVAIPVKAQVCPSMSVVSGSAALTGATCSTLPMPVATAMSPTMSVGGLLAGGCSPVTNVTMTGAVVGVNGIVAAPIYTTAPTGNQGLLNVSAWVSSANTVSVQACALGTLTTTPNFVAKLLMY